MWYRKKTEVRSQRSEVRGIGMWNAECGMRKVRDWRLKAQSKRGWRLALRGWRFEVGGRKDRRLEGEKIKLWITVDGLRLMVSQKVGNLIFVHFNILNLQAQKFDFCAFCAFSRLYQGLRFNSGKTWAPNHPNLSRLPNEISVALISSGLNLFVFCLTGTILTI